MSETETLVQKHMRLLGISEDEAKALIEADKAIDKGEKMDFDLTPEQAKNAKKYTKTGTKKPTVYKFDTEKAKSRKKDDEKGEFISKIAEFIGKFVQNVEIVNAEREISFEIGENSYSLTLTKHRKAKKQCNLMKEWQEIGKIHKVLPIFLCILPIDKQPQVWYNGPPVHKRHGRNFGNSNVLQIFHSIFVQFAY